MIDFEYIDEKKNVKGYCFIRKENVISLLVRYNGMIANDRYFILIKYPSPFIDVGEYELLYSEYKKIGRLLNE